VRGQPLCDPSSLVTALNAGRYTAIPSECRAYADHPLTYGIERSVSRRYCDDGRFFLNGRMRRVCVDLWSMPGETPPQAVIQARLQRERARLRRRRVPHRRVATVRGLAPRPRRRRPAGFLRH